MVEVASSNLAGPTKYKGLTRKGGPFLFAGELGENWHRFDKTRPRSVLDARRPQVEDARRVITALRP